MVGGNFYGSGNGIDDDDVDGGKSVAEGNMDGGGGGGCKLMTEGNVDGVDKLVAEGNKNGGGDDPDGSSVKVQVGSKFLSDWVAVNWIAVKH